MKINLIVIRSQDIEMLSAFYASGLNITFERHKHGSGLEHLSTEIDGVVFEIYPQKNETDSTASIRLGFVVESINGFLKRVKDFQFTVISQPKNSLWGLRMVLDDPEGHRLELVENGQ
ncbi:MAG: VOC family protein [Cyanobacteria bacterium P01_E01_bin.42]